MENSPGWARAKALLRCTLHVLRAVDYLTANSPLESAVLRKGGTTATTKAHAQVVALANFSRGAHPYVKRSYPAP
eukprot:1031736-Rhodomonas_salina.4